MNIFNPKTPLIPEPVNLAEKIQELQIYFNEALPWLDTSYGIAELGYTRTSKPAKVPEVWDGEQYTVLTPNNQIAALSFFKRESGAKYDNYVAGLRNNVEYRMSLIVLCQLDQIKAIMEYDHNHRFTEELKKELLTVFSELPQIRLISHFEDPADVFAGYTYVQDEPATLRHPFACFKFVFDIKFLEDC